MDTDNTNEKSVTDFNNAEDKNKNKMSDEIKNEANIKNMEKTSDEVQENIAQTDKESIKSITDQRNIEVQETEGKVKEDTVQASSEKEDNQEVVEEEETFVEEPPPDPAAPLNLSDSSEALKPKFTLRPDQLIEVEQLWELYQDYNPAYTDIHNYITEKELVYMLKCLLLMTYTPEQLQELIDYCVKPPHPEGHISFEQFLKMVTIRKRDLPVEEELRSALQSLDIGNAGAIDRTYLKEVLSKQGNKLSQRQLDNFIKEVDLSNDGTIGVEDVVGTLCIDLNRDDIVMLLAQLNPAAQENKEEDF